MESTARAHPRVLSPFRDGFRMTFLAWSPTPGPVVTWNLLQRRFTRVGRWLRSNTFFWLLALVAFGIGVAAGQGLSSPPVPAPLLTGLLAAAPVVVARYNLLLGWRVGAIASLSVAIVSLSTAIAEGSSRTPDGIVAMVAVGLTVFTIAVAATHERSIGLWAWFATILILSAVTISQPGVVAILGGLVALVIDGLRSRRVAAQELSDERERLDAERARRENVEERARIARELHDVVAHHMSIVAVRAETAPYRIDGLSDGAKTEFAEISNAARESLTEIRGLLTLLRDDDTPRLPQPGLDQVDDLVESAKSAGADVALHITGDRRALRAAVEVAAYRILQESLANVTRHAPGETAEVWVDYGKDALTLLVTNPSADPVSPPGHGMTGMQERATAVGGTVDARRRADGKFVVEASLPVEP